MIVCVCTRAGVPSSGTARAVMPTTITPTDAISDSTTILRWVIWSAVLNDALLMVLSVPLRRRSQDVGSRCANEIAGWPDDARQQHPTARPHPTNLEV